MTLNSLSKDTLNLQQNKIEIASTGQQILDALAKFIPTEVLAPYVAALSLIAEGTPWDEGVVYRVFIVATPIAFLFFYFVNIALDETASWPTWDDAPLLVWRSIAAPIAFSVWALAVPTNGLQDTIGGAGVAAFIAVVVSPILTGIDVILKRIFKW